MRTLFRALFAGTLALLARAIVRKYHPTIVMVTGSVGKTSTKDAVAATLSTSYHVRKSEKGFNSDFGVPFTIMGVQNPWRSVPAWLNLFGEALALIFLPNRYPNMLVLEVGADAPGDLARILKIATPNAVVVTLLPSVPVHVEAYETPAAVREEEFAPAFALPPHSPLIISCEDDYALNLSKKLDVHMSSFGTGSDATVRITDIGVWMGDKGGKSGHIPQGMQATFVIDGTSYPFHVVGVFGRTQLNAPAAAIAAALSLGVPVKTALTSLATYSPPPGRGRLFAGKKNILLIDDTYNSSPVAAEEILKSMALLPRSVHRVAILGDMLELGRYSAAEHIRIGHIAKESVDLLITVGPRAQAIGEAALADGMPEGSVFAFNNSIDASEAIGDHLQEGDVVLVKGSQGVRLERITEALLADSSDASELVRQEKEWLKR